MRAGDLEPCIDFPCADVRHSGYAQSALPDHPESIRVIMITAAPPADQSEPLNDYTDPVVCDETLRAFRAAGYKVSTIADIRNLGVHVTTAVKCPKLGYGLKPETIANCSYLLEQELAQFPNVKSILLMGNTAIRAIHQLALRTQGEAAIPTGSAYKVKKHEYKLGDISLFPSYPTSGQNVSVEVDRQEVVAVDIRNAIEVAGGPATWSHRTGPSRERRRSPGSRPHEFRERSVGLS